MMKTFYEKNIDSHQTSTNTFMDHPNSESRDGSCVDDHHHIDLEKQEHKHQKKCWIGKKDNKHDEQECVDNYVMCDCIANRRWILAVLILLVGSASCIAFVSSSITDEMESSTYYYTQSATEIANSIRSAWHEYEVFALWAHESCGQLGVENPQSISETIKICTQDDFLHMYETILSIGLDLYALQYVAKVEHQYREQVEEQLRESVQEVGVNFTGFTTFPFLERQTEQPFYYPILLAEPFQPNAAIIGLDTYGDAHGAALIDLAFETWKPVLSDGVSLVQDKEDAYFGTKSVFLTHPGVNTSLVDTPHAVTATIIRIPDLIAWAASQTNIRGRAVYLYDAEIGSNDDRKEPEDWAFLGGSEIRDCSSLSCPTQIDLKKIPETNLTDIPRQGAHYYENVLKIANRQWKVVVVPLDDRHDPELFYLILGGVLIFLAFLLLSVVFWRYLERMALINDIKNNAEAEKAEMAMGQVKRERHLNEVSQVDPLFHNTTYLSPEENSHPKRFFCLHALSLFSVFGTRSKKSIGICHGSSKFCVCQHSRESERRRNSSTFVR